MRTVSIRTKSCEATNANRGRNRPHAGPGCTQRYDPCFPNPCQNGGSCWPSLDSFYCSCARSFTGDTCELNAIAGGSQLPPSAPADAMARTQGQFSTQREAVSGARVHTLYAEALSNASYYYLILLANPVLLCSTHNEILYVRCAKS